MNRRKQNTMIKKALKEAFPDALKIRVETGKGTAWGWWHVGVDVEHPKNCTCKHNDNFPEPKCNTCSEAYRSNRNKAIFAVKNSGAETYKYSDDGYEYDEIIANINFVKL